MNALDVNEELNNLKDKYPGDVALVESVQNLFNKETFPMQFTKRIPTSSGEWTTQLHIWADNQVPALLDIDPIILTARNSDGETVLMSLLMAATGRFTQQVNYALIKKILDTDMQFEYLTEPMDENSVETGNVWDEEDLDHKTALQYLADFAKGTGPFLGTGGDDRSPTTARETVNRSPTRISMRKRHRSRLKRRKPCETRGKPRAQPTSRQPNSQRSRNPNRDSRNRLPPSQHPNSRFRSR